MKKEKRNIQCNVSDCKHNDCSCNYCTLSEIKVCHCNDEETKEATMCDSYKQKDE